jgi:hypothetical protein
VGVPQLQHHAMVQPTTQTQHHRNGGSTGVDRCTYVYQTAFARTLGAGYCSSFPRSHVYAGFRVAESRVYRPWPQTVFSSTDSFTRSCPRFIYPHSRSWPQTGLQQLGNICPKFEHPPPECVLRIVVEGASDSVVD